MSDGDKSGTTHYHQQGPEENHAGKGTYQTQLTSTFSLSAEAQEYTAALTWAPPNICTYLCEQADLTKGTNILPGQRLSSMEAPVLDLSIVNDLKALLTAIPASEGEWAGTLLRLCLTGETADDLSPRGKSHTGDFDWKQEVKLRV
ncbi:hypothetical protein TREES_T100010166 [Tupaia chinensis]|uniref:Uncharacterized protein n=1 Tax=Tupaia chinensis TaxID=246437 RepID=L9JBS0_TUPCH|nr:hypothetical protein TREES_T100010166 [Tupaia chinensis]